MLVFGGVLVTMGFFHKSRGENEQLYNMKPPPSSVLSLGHKLT